MPYIDVETSAKPIGIIGTGKMATGLGACFAKGGFSIQIASRSPGRMGKFASELKKIVRSSNGDHPSSAISGGTTEIVLQQCQLIVLAIPTHIRNEQGKLVDGVVDFLAKYKSQLEGQSKILLDITYYGQQLFGNPTPPTPYRSAIEYHATQLDDSKFLGRGGSTQWVCGFKSVNWTSLRDGKTQGIEIAGDRGAREILSTIMLRSGFKPLNCGSIEEAGKTEPGSAERDPHPEASI